MWEATVLATERLIVRGPYGDDTYRPNNDRTTISYEPREELIVPSPGCNLESIFRTPVSTNEESVGVRITNRNIRLVYCACYSVTAYNWCTEADR